MDFRSAERRFRLHLAFIRCAIGLLIRGSEWMGWLTKHNRFRQRDHVLLFALIAIHRHIGTRLGVKQRENLIADEMRKRWLTREREAFLRARGYREKMK